MNYSFFLDARYPQMYAVWPSPLITYSFIKSHPYKSKYDSAEGHAVPGGVHSVSSLFFQYDPGVAKVEISFGPETVIPIGAGCPVCLESSCKGN